MAGTTRIVASVLGVLAGLVGVYHGYNEILQGSVATGGIFINAIGPPCQGNACFPAMTLVPDFYLTGLTAVSISLVIAVWSTLFINRKNGGVVLIVLSIVQLLVGGGFLPPALGVVAGLVATRTRRS